MNMIRDTLKLFPLYQAIRFQRKLIISYSKIEILSNSGWSLGISKLEYVQIRVYTTT